MDGNSPINSPGLAAAGRAPATGDAPDAARLHPPFGAPVVDVQQLAALRWRPPQALDEWLPASGPAPAYGPGGDLVLSLCEDGLPQRYIAPLQCHLLLHTTAGIKGCVSWLPGEGLKQRTLAAGSTLILPAGEAGFVHWPAEHRLLLIGLRPRLLYPHGQSAYTPTLHAHSGLTDAVIAGLVSALQAALEVGGSVDSHGGRTPLPGHAVQAVDQAVKHMAHALAAHLHAHHATETLAQRDSLSQFRLTLALAFLESRLAEPVHLTEAAEVAGCSLHHFSHLFKTAMGVSPMRYLRELRMRRARELVETTQLSMSEIGAQVGLPEASRFSQAFRSHWQMSPSSLRRPGRRSPR